MPLIHQANIQAPVLFLRGIQRDFPLMFVGYEILFDLLMVCQANDELVQIPETYSHQVLFSRTT